MYEPTDEGAPLTLIGINTDLISQFPDETNQADLLRSDAVTQKIQANFDREINLIVKPFDKTFSLDTETDGPAITKFSFKPSRRFSYEMTCVEVDELNCAKALDLYSQELRDIRLRATKDGYANSMKLIDSLLAADIQLSDADKSQLNLQKNAFNQAIQIASGEIVQISEGKYFGGETVQTVDVRTYLFGLMVGLIFGLIILMQFVVGDDKIRSIRGLISASGYDKYLGAIDSRANSTELLAAAIRGAAGSSPKKIKLLPVGDETIDGEIALELAKILGVQVEITKSLSGLTAAELKPSTEASFVVAVLKDRASVNQVKQAVSIVEKSGNSVIGSALITR